MGIYGRPKPQPRQVCSHAEDHTPCPDGYLDWHAWAEGMSKTHKQRKCEGCGRYEIWEPKAPDTGEGEAR